MSYITYGACPILLMGPVLYYLLKRPDVHIRHDASTGMVWYHTIIQSFAIM